MAQVKKKEIQELDLSCPIEDELDFFFSRFFGATYPTLYRKELIWRPPTDFYETENDFVVVLELAQVSASEVSVTLQEGVLSIRGIRKMPIQDEPRQYHKMEINYGPFEQKLYVPGDVDMENLSAQFSDGFLKIRLPKKTPPLAGAVDIKVE